MYFMTRWRVFVRRYLCVWAHSVVSVCVCVCFVLPERREWEYLEFYLCARVREQDCETGNLCCCGSLVKQKHVLPDCARLCEKVGETMCVLSWTGWGVLNVNMCRYPNIRDERRFPLMCCVSTHDARWYGGSKQVCLIWFSQGVCVCVYSAQYQFAKAEITTVHTLVGFMNPMHSCTRCQIAINLPFGRLTGVTMHFKNPSNLIYTLHSTWHIHTPMHILDQQWYCSSSSSDFVVVLLFVYYVPNKVCRAGTNVWHWITSTTTPQTTTGRSIFCISNHKVAH